MASVKIASLFLKTLAKPISQKLKQQAREHEGFREATISMAQFLHRAEINMRIKLLGETHHPKHIRPLNDAKAIDAGANFISETFLFSFAALLILGETYRSRRAEGKRRDAVTDRLDELEEELAAVRTTIEYERNERLEGINREKELEKVVEEIVGIGLRGGWLTEPSAGWAEHARLGAQARALGAVPTRVKGNEEEDDGHLQASVVLQELDELNKARIVKDEAREEVESREAGSNP